MESITLIRSIWKRILEEIYIKPVTRNNHERNISKSNTLLLISHPRGGSNWLGEILMQIPNSALIDEPFWRGFYRSPNDLPGKYEGKIKQLAKLDFYFDQFIPPNIEWEEVVSTVSQILKAEHSLYDLWDRNKLTEINRAEIYIFKVCYGHLLLPWLHKNFNFKSIVLHRHPCAVVASQLNYIVFKNIPLKLSGGIPGCRFNDIYIQYKHIFNSITSKEEYLAAIWSLKTKYIIEESINLNSNLNIYYEEVINNFEENIQKINTFLGKEYLSNNFYHKTKPSASIPKNGHLLVEDMQIAKWKKSLEMTTIEKILRVVRKFDIEIYDDRIMPHYS